MAHFNLARLGAELLAARKTTTYVADLASHPAMTLPVEYFNRPLN
jgi:hypothetical protein